jgi:chromodomain-helicase-DNA-binding protein 4
MMKVSAAVRKFGFGIALRIIATWDSPPRQGEPGYPAFKVAFERFLDSRRVHIKRRNKKQIEVFENRRKNEFRQKYALKQDEQPDLGQQEHLKLMPFQVNSLDKVLISLTHRTFVG